jgi:hypothetical protein
MKITALMPVRNEDYVCGLTARAALLWCDSLIFLNHASTDRTGDIIAEVKDEFRGRVASLIDDDPCWNEMIHRQRLLEAARLLGATHIAIIDADELLAGNLLPTIRGLVEHTSPGSILQLPGYNLRGGLEHYHSNGIWGNRTFSLAFKDDARLNWQGDQFHHREPFGMHLNPFRPIPQGQGGILHLWGVDERRLLAKSALYKVTERLRWPAKPIEEIDGSYNLAIHRWASNASRWDYAGVPEEWWEPYRDLMPHLDIGAEPWQIAEVSRLIAEHGRERFRGLDLFEIDQVAVGASS